MVKGRALARVRQKIGLLTHNIEALRDNRRKLRRDFKEAVAKVESTSRRVAKSEYVSKHISAKSKAETELRAALAAYVRARDENALYLGAEKTRSKRGVAAERAAALVQGFEREYKRRLGIAEKARSISEKDDEALSTATAAQNRLFQLKERLRDIASEIASASQELEEAIEELGKLERSRR